ncbi:uncharacterized protein [Spinacia oleracea]|uniref:Uncharacterized protein isoform X4 n=1 Tax=Spinacia oleracea TaxID=3562 RepID=A0A9R0IGH0_SPIOL|nr:uncharacterized protein LOC110787362 isoform X4 [Spinacia oleracea]
MRWVSPPMSALLVGSNFTPTPSRYSIGIARHSASSPSFTRTVRNFAISQWRCKFLHLLICFPLRLQTLFDHLGGFCIFYFAILGLVVGKEFKNEYLGSYLSFLRVLSHFRNSLQMESGVSSGGGLSSLGYRFGSGEAPKPASTKAPANVCVEPVMKEATRPGAAADNPQHSYLKKVPAGVNSNINNYYHADGQNTGNFITSMMHLKIMVMEERSQARDDAYVYIAS